MARSDVIGCTKGGATASVKFISLVIPVEHNHLAKTTQKCLWCSWSQSLMVLLRCIKDWDQSFWQQKFTD